MRLFIYQDTIINTDNETDAENILSDPLTKRELSENEIKQTFGKYAHLSGPDTTTIKEDGTIVFVLPAEYKDFETWLNTFVRPVRDEKLKACDKYMIPDYPVEESEKTKWVNYRLKLRNLPTQLTQITDPIPWPGIPGETA